MTGVSAQQSSETATVLVPADAATLSGPDVRISGDDAESGAAPASSLRHPPGRGRFGDVSGTKPGAQPFAGDPASGGFVAPNAGALSVGAGPVENSSGHGCVPPAGRGVPRERCLRAVVDPAWYRLAVQVPGRIAALSEHDRRTSLRDALQDLKEVAEEAECKEFSAPSVTAIRNADRLLRIMHDVLPLRYEVYPDPDGEIAIHAVGDRECSILVLCESPGSALCMIDIREMRYRKRYATVDVLPDPLLRAALAALGRRLDTRLLNLLETASALSAEAFDRVWRSNRHGDTANRRDCASTVSSTTGAEGVWITDANQRDVSMRTGQYRNRRPI